MGIVNSFVNQIGREMGRDTYRSITTSGKTIRSKQHYESTESLLESVKSFELLNRQEDTIRQITNLVEKSENANPEDFEWQELFVEIDNKIDFCKENLSVEYQLKLEQLDKRNADNYQKIKNKHIEYIEQIIAFLKNTSIQPKTKNKKIATLLSFIGLRPYYMDGKHTLSIYNLILIGALTAIFYKGYITFDDPISNAGNMHIETSEQIEKVSRIGMSLMICILILYFIYLRFALKKIATYKAPINENQNQAQQFQVYLDQLNRF